MFEVIVVGSGPAGVFATKELQDKKILILDVGYEAPKNNFLNENMYTLKQKKESMFEELIGKNFESLHNIFHSYLSPKLKSPYLRYTIQNWKKLSPVQATNFDLVMSFAKGGLANAWGAGSYRFTDEELKYFPISYSDLKEFYDKATKEIGISGIEDDLYPFFQSTQGLLPPFKLSRMAQSFLKNYSKKKKHFHNHGIFVGYPRIALLTQNYRDRKAHQYNNLGFFKPELSSIYNPSYTLKNLSKLPNVTYLRGKLVEKYIESNGSISILCKNLNTAKMEKYDAQKLILSAGALNSAKIVLASQNDFTTKCHLLDNAISYVPFLKPPLIGKAIESQSEYVQLNIIYKGPLAKGPIIASFYEINGPLKSDLIFDFPLDIQGAIYASKYLSSALGIVQIFYPDQPIKENYLKLNPDMTLNISYQSKKLGVLEKHFIQKFRKIGFLSMPFLCKYPAPGNSFHYAGTLPMSTNPKKYETSPEGLLYGSKRVYVADGATFPRLPSKNLTLTIMANAMRIARKVRESL